LQSLLISTFALACGIFGYRYLNMK